MDSNANSSAENDDSAWRKKDDDDDDKEAVILNLKSAEKDATERQSSLNIPEAKSTIKTKPTLGGKSSTPLHATQVQTNPYRLCSAYAGYRILRLSLELFILSHTLKGGFSISMAGTFFLVYSICDIVSGSIFLWYPALFVGSRTRALVFFFSTVGSQIAGFILFFVSHNGILMALSIGMCGMGTSSWFVNYQTLINASFPRDELKKAASIRLLFEAIGFLLPSITLAIFHFVIPENLADDIFSITAFVLGAIASAFYIASFSDVVKLAAMPTTQGTGSQYIKLSVWQCTKLFFKSSTLRYFLLNSILLATNNIIGGTMAIMTTYHFRLEDTSLWAGVIGIPIGAMFSATIALFVGRFDETLRFYISSFWLIFTFVLLLASTGGAIEHFEDRTAAAYAALFSFGVVVGYFFSEVWSVAFTCWLKELKSHSTDFVSRANSFHNIGTQAVLAIAFQLQTLALDAIGESSLDKTMRDILTGTAIYGMLLFLTLICLYLYASRPTLIKLSRFQWQMEFPMKSIVVKAVAFITGVSVESTLFGSFCGFRTNSLIDALDDDALTDGGVGSKGSRALQFGNFVSFLKEFCEENKGKTSDEFTTNEDVNVNGVLFSNAMAFEARMDLIKKAEKSIVLLTWGLDGDMAMEIANQLITMRRDFGIDIKVMIDGVNFHYLCLLLNTTDGEQNNLMVLKKLAREGIDTRFLLEDVKDSNGSPSKYKCGSHRKILLVDDKYIVSGGRNTEDSYLKDEGVYNDTDIILQGDFASSTAKMLDSFWNSGTDILQIIKDCKYLDEVSQDDEGIMIRRRSSLLSGIRRRSSLLSVNSHRPSSSLLNMNRRRSSLLSVNRRRSSSSLLNMNRRRSSLLNVLAESSFALTLDENGDSKENHNERAGRCQLIQLNHLAGNTNGVDIIYSTILKLIECATSEINFVFGYFHLFPHMEKALAAAIERGVKVRLFTNSSDTSDLYFFASLFEKTQGRLLEMGAEVFVFDLDKNLIEDGGVRCAHHKFVTIDNRAVLCGSWNCIGSSIFYDSEFAMLLFADEESCDELCQPFNEYIRTSSEEGIYTKLEKAPPVSTLHPLMKMAISKQSIVCTTRGF